MRDDSASGGSNEDRNAEAHRILFEMKLGDMVGSFEQDKENDFVQGLLDKFDDYGTGTFVSSKQIFWLRDLKEKYL